MASKIVLFVLGLAVGAGICAAVLIQKANKDSAAATAAAVASTSSSFANQVADLEATLASTKNRLEDAQSSSDKLAARVQELMKKEAAAQAAAASAEKPKKKGLAALFDNDGGTNGLSEAFGGMMQSAIKQQIEGKMSGLKAKLNLTPEQEKSVRDIMEKQMSKGTEIAEKMLKGELSKEELTNIGKEQSSEKDQIKALLTPEQVKAYDEYEKEEKSRMARLVANSELIQMQTTLQLTEEQQDRVFAVLSQQAETQIDPNTGAPQDFDFRKQLDQKKEALRAVLTPEQFERYNKQQEEQLKLIEMFLPKDDTKPNAVQKVPEIPK